MIRVLFVCLGNICRSPMGEFIFKDLVKKEGGPIAFILLLRVPAPKRRGIPFIRPRGQSWRGTALIVRGNLPFSILRQIIKNMIIFLRWKPGTCRVFCAVRPIRKAK